MNHSRYMRKRRNMKTKFWTLRYVIINMTYFAVFCGIHAYSSVFLLDKGFTNTEIGITLAIANILSVLLQPIVAGWIDKGGRLTNRNVSMASTLFMIIGSLLLLFIKEEKIIIFIIFALIYMVQMMYQPLIIAMNFEYTKAGCNINFGLARGLGSTGFAIFSATMGTVVAKQGVDVLPIANIIILTLSFIMLLTFVKPSNVSGTDERAESPDISNANAPEAVAHNNIIDFAKMYPKFMLLLFGTVCFYFAHNAINDFLIQIITPLGGTESQMGIAIFIAAFLELPTMACINFLMEKIKCAWLIIIAGIMFTVKIAIITCATGMAGVYASECCQIAAYAVFIPAAAYYVNQTMEEMDQVKGQAYINSAITLGGVFSSLVCGRVLDLSGPKVMLLICTCVSLVGTVITFIAVRPQNQKSSGH